MSGHGDSPPTADGIDEVDFDVPADADPARCPDCGRPYAREALLALHRGQVHGEALDATGRADYERAQSEETERLGLFRLKALLALIALYFGLLLIYALV